MARRRDYKKEHEQRNAKARELGFSNYNALRSALKKGKVQRSAKGVQFAPSKRIAQRAYQRAGWETPEEYTFMQKENRDWQKQHSHSARSAQIVGSSPEAQRAYYDAYVKGRNPDRLLDMKHYIVDVRGLMTGAEFDRKYFKK